MNLIEIFCLSFDQLNWTFFTIFAELDIHTIGEIIVLTEEQFCFFVVAIISSDPSEHKDTFFQSFPERIATDGIWVGSWKSFDLIFLKISVLVIERLSCSRSGSSRNIIIVFELPISPAPEMQLHQIGENSDFFCAFWAIWECSKLSQESSCFHWENVLLFWGDLKSVKCFADFWWLWFTQCGYKWTVYMVAKDLSL